MRHGGDSVEAARSPCRSDFRRLHGATATCRGGPHDLGQARDAAATRAAAVTSGEVIVRRRLVKEALTIWIVLGVQRGLQI